MGWKRILVPHDFSPCAVRAERLAAELAELHLAQLLLLHVTSAPGLDPETEVGFSERAEAAPLSRRLTGEPKARLEHIAATLRVRGLTVETEALVGPLAATILEQAEKHRSDVIVMGTHGRKGIQRLLLGSVAEDVLRRAHIPVVTIRYEDEEAATPLLVPSGA
jgi:nucleotide-binding universal stress UspA family protein